MPGFPARRASRLLTLLTGLGALCVAPAALRAQGIAGPGSQLPAAATGASVTPMLDLERHKQEERQKEEERRAALQAPIPVDVLAVAFPIAGAIDDQVALLVEIGGKQLLVGNDGVVEGQIEAAILNSSGTSVDQFTQPFALDATDERLQAAGLKLYGVLRVAPGDYKVRVQVGDKAGAKGSREVAVHAPDFARKEPVLSPPLFPDPPDRWRVFQQSDSPHADLPFPFVDGQGGGFLPSAAPAISPDGGSAVVYAYGPAGDAPKLSARLSGDKGAAATPKVTLLESGQGKFTIQRRLLMRVEGPLPEGAQRLEVAVAAPDATRTTSTALAVRAQAAPQAELKASTDTPMEQEPVEEAPALAPGFTKEDLTARYRDVLARAAAGELDAAVHQLAELEVAATPGHRNGELKALREVERQTVEAQRAGLLPVAYLHTRLDEELRQRAETWLIAQNRIWLADLMERWVKSSGDAEAKHVAAQLLAGVGSSKEALEYEPGNELALLRLAISAEKTGRMPEAEEALKRLLQAHPDDQQGRLRLAVVKRRAGDEKEAARLLAALIADPKVPKWVSSLAVQQLAELNRADGQEQQAETVLRQGIDKIGTQALYLQLAFYLDERQKADEAVQVLNGMPISAGPEEVSGRFLYNEPPRAEIAQARQQVEARVVGEWPQLRASLAAAGQLAGSR